MSVNRFQRVLALELKSSSAMDEAPDVSIHAALALLDPTFTLAANGTIPTDTRVLVVWVPNIASRNWSAAVFSALILEPPLPADSLIEPEVSSTSEISSSMPLATAWAVTGMLETPTICEKKVGTLALVSRVAVIELRSMVALVTVIALVAL